MDFLAHRGIWRKPEECNSLQALEEAARNGFGIETDVRDAQGEVVIAHDPPVTFCMPLSKLLTSCPAIGIKLPFAINVKADGLHKKIHECVTRHNLSNYFCFDMSVPQALSYSRRGLRFFSRQSELEPNPSLYVEADGIWMDMFFEEWIQPESIVRHLELGKTVCVVSPELHGRSHLAFWERIRSAGIALRENFMMCTDYPVEARSFFGE